MIDSSTTRPELPFIGAVISAIARAVMPPAALAVTGLTLVSTAGHGQLFPLKTLPGEPSPCVATASLPGSPVGADPANRMLVDSLLAAGSQAAILGEYASARTSLERAAEVDPANPVVAYRLARTLDDEGDTAGAIREYCRLLALAPSAPDARIASERTRALTGGGAPLDPWSMAIDEGVEAHAGGRHRDAIEAFTRAIELRPDDAMGYFNRGIAFHSDGRPEIAINDLERYLAINPTAADRTVVATEVRNLRVLAGLPPAGPVRGTAPASAVLAQGLVIPGLGQHATGRTGLGIAILAAAGGAVYYGARQQVAIRKEGAYDPFGNYYEYDVRVADRPNLTAGVAAAAAIAVVAALESYLYARRVEYESSVPVARRAETASAALPSCAYPTTASRAAPTALFPRILAEGCSLEPEPGSAVLAREAGSEVPIPYLPGGRRPLQ